MFLMVHEHMQYPFYVRLVHPREMKVAHRQNLVQSLGRAVAHVAEHTVPHVLKKQRLDNTKQIIQWKTSYFSIIALFGGDTCFCPFV